MFSKFITQDIHRVEKQTLVYIWLNRWEQKYSGFLEGYIRSNTSVSSEHWSLSFVEGRESVNQANKKNFYRYIYRYISNYFCNDSYNKHSITKEGYGPKSLPGVFGEMSWTLRESQDAFWLISKVKTSLAIMWLLDFLPLLGPTLFLFGYARGSL